MNSTYYHPPFSLLLDSEQWLEINDDCPFAAVFNHQGLLTDQLKITAKKSLKVECVLQAFDEQNTAQRRDVALLVDETATVLASTIIPEPVLRDCPTLLTLGNNPIGEHLEQNYAAKRGKSKFQVVPAEDQLNQNFPEDGTCFLRRYDYLLDSGKVTIVELFSPDILRQLDALQAS